MVLLGHERLDDDRGELGVVQGGERVADVVHQRAHHVLLVAAVALRARRGLQAVGQPIDGVASRVAGEEREVTQNPVGQALQEADRMPEDERVFLRRGVRHPRERGRREVVWAHTRLIPHPGPG